MKGENLTKGTTMSEDKSLLDQLREQRTALLDEAASSIEQRENERKEFSERESKMVNEIRVEVEKITRDEAKPAEEKRDAVKAADQPLVEARSSFAAAEATFESEFNRRDDEIKNLTRRISEQEVIEFRKELAAKASVSEVRVEVGNEEKTYRRFDDAGRSVSYFRDFATTNPQLASAMNDTHGASERLKRHAEEMEVELPKRAEARERRANQQVNQAEHEFRSSFVNMNARGGFEASPFEKRITPNRTDGQGGFFVGGDLVLA